jgi:hypothetical protein
MMHVQLVMLFVFLRSCMELILMVSIATHTAGCSGFLNASDQTTAPLTFQPLTSLRASAVVHYARCRCSACEILRSIDLGRSA